MSDQTSAESHAREVLERTGHGLMTGDFDVFASCFLFPQHVETFDGKRYMETRAEMRPTFDAVRAYYSKMQVTDMVRHCVTAVYRDQKTISTIHQTRLVSGSRLIQKPYNVFSVLSLVDGKWLVAQSQYAVDDSPSLCHALVGTQPTEQA